jgi:DNA polymerase
VAYADAIHIDIETYSEAKLKTTGLYRYAEDPTTEILCVCYAKGDGPVTLWVPWGSESWHQEELPAELADRLSYELSLEFEELGDILIQPAAPKELVEHAKAGGEFRAHNSQFERVMLNSHAGGKIGFPNTEIGQWVCTAAKMAAHSLPRALGNAATALGTYLKDEAGKMDMLHLCKPRTGKEKRWTPENAPGRFYNLYRYCVGDVLAEQGIDLAVPDLPPNEQRAFELDQEINDTGVRIDQEAIHKIKRLIDEHKRDLKKKCKEITNGISPAQTAQLADWIRRQGFEIENLQAPTMKEALSAPDIPRRVKQVLSIRLLYSMKAVSKYDRMLQAVSSDGRLHGMFLYHGASTGRWASMIVQLQNLFRPLIKDVEQAIVSFDAQDLEWVRMLFDMDPMKVFASCIRGMIIPSEGHDLIAMDYSAIEARVIAWLAGQQDILDVFEDHGLIYEHTAAKIFSSEYPGGATRAQLEEMEKKHWMRRFIGKIAVLALGYQGGKNAFAKMARQYGVDIPEEEADKIKNDWREANPHIVRLWYSLEEAAAKAMLHPGQPFAIPNKKIKFYRPKGSKFLYMRLPSGRKIAYFMPQIDDSGKLTYMGVDTYSRRWMRCDTYGGKLAENAVQAIARDLLLSAMFRLTRHGYTIIGTVHDETIMEALQGWGSLEEVSAIMCQKDEWAEGLPIAAAGWRGPRYRK